MTKPVLGMAAGTVLGLFDGLSAWAYPEARTMIASIVIGSTIKGLVTGAATGWLARVWRSTALGIVAGIVIGFVLSSLAALPVMQEQPARYFDIVLPGMLLGAIVGFVTQRYPRRGTSTGSSAALVLILLALPATAIAGRQNASTGSLQRLDVLIGRWQGTSEGQPGAAKVEREYTRILNEKFIRVKNRSVYPVQEKNPKGEVHEDEGVFSFDAARKSVVFRQFHGEGFVNQYVEERPSQPSTYVFTTEAIENIPAGWRARETYIVRGPDEFEEVFELAGPGKPFEVYSRARLNRVRDDADSLGLHGVKHPQITRITQIHSWSWPRRAAFDAWWRRAAR